MESRKCMIAGLPSSGKSTYIGALWYNLFNCNEHMMMQSDHLPNDTSLLGKMECAWQSFKKIDRNSTEQNIVDDVEIFLKMKNSPHEIALNVPDFWGEKFYNIIEKANTKDIEEWCKQSDSLFYMMHDVKPSMFIEDDKVVETQEKHVDVPPFETKSMSLASLNIMILKFLFAHKKFKRVVIAVTRWDCITDNGIDHENPEEWLKSHSPALFNFVKHYYPDVYIIGLSAQGCDYDAKDFDIDMMLDKTEKGTRAFIDDAHGICYDLSKPLNFLLS